MKTVLVFDKSSGRRDAHCKVLADLGHSVFCYANGNIEFYPPSTLTVPAAYNLILLHSNDKTDFDRLNISGPILNYGGSEIVKAGRIPRGVSADCPISEEEMSAIIAALDALDPATFESAIAAIWSSVPEDLLSWVLLEKFGAGVVGADTQKAKIQAAAERAIRNLMNDPMMELTIPNAQKVLDKYRADF